MGRTTYLIIKAKVDGNEYIGDANNCFEGTTDKNKNLQLVEKYWKNNMAKESRVETLVNSKIKVIEI